MKEAINILRKAINSEDEFRQRYSHPTMLNHSENHYNEYKLLNQPEHKAQGWELGTSPYGNGLPVHGVPEDHKVKAVEIRTPHRATTPAQKHVLYKDHSDTEYPWKRTSVLEHDHPFSGKQRDPGLITDKDSFKTLHAAVADTRMRAGDYSPSHITKIHYHPE